jgi:AcrR family transcriptional regulator
MGKKDDSARSKIIAATIDCIEREGIQSLTIRKIAREAGVNGAAINYYFGTKDALVEKAMRRTLDEMMKMPEEIFDAAKGEALDRIETFFIAFLEGLVRWRGIVKAHLYEPLMEGHYETDFIRRFGEFLAAVAGRVRSAIPFVDETVVRMSIIQTVSAVMLPGLLPKAFLRFSALDFEKPEVRSAYVRALVRKMY